ncbi:hypothetical protein [Nonomuraea lactucae]|uniref:hypothetical protein n=1 Tax=Nonomuraea lactucae TaxID=2249762 RepID=UPI0013B454A7|nr:hypothetical protein [Nonomuraea lactucae]
MSEVVPLPSFGEVFFDARGQERCLRVTWHEGTLVLSLWRGEMCTASFRMPMDDVGRLLDTLDEGYAEATGEQPAEPAHDPGTEVIPGTGQYQRPPQPVSQPMSQSPGRQQDERPAGALSPNDVLVARGAPAQDKPAPQDKLVASYSETTGPRDQYGERPPFTGPQYSDPGQPHTGRQYREQAREPFTGPQYVDEATPTGPQYSLDPDPFSGPHQAAPSAGHHYQAQRERPAPLSTDPLGFPSQAADPFASQATSAQAADPLSAPRQDRYAQPDHGRSTDYGQADYSQSDYNQSDYNQSDYGQQPVPQHVANDTSTAGLGTPMHGIPGAGRRRDPGRSPGHDRYPTQGAYSSGDSFTGGASYSSQDAYPASDAYPAPDAHRRANGYPGQNGYPGGDAYSSGDSYSSQDTYSGQDTYAGHDGFPPRQGRPGTPNPVDPLLALGEPGGPYGQQDSPLSRPYVGDPMFSTGERLRPEQQHPDRPYDGQQYDGTQYGEGRYGEPQYGDRSDRHRDW